MKRLMQNGPFLFQTQDMHTIVNFQGVVSIEGIESEIYVSPDRLQLTHDGKAVTYRLPGNLKSVEGDKIGCGIWLSSLAMMVWLSDNREIFAGKSVLELGCGLAVPAQFISEKCCAARVTACDYNRDIIIESLKANDNQRVIPLYYDWEQTEEKQPDNSTVNIRSLGPYDIIIACDVMYRNSGPYILSTLERYLRPDGSFIVINAIRQEAVDESIYGLMAMFDDVVCHNFDLIETIEVGGAMEDHSTELLILIGRGIKVKDDGCNSQEKNIVQGGNAESSLFGPGGR